MNGAHLHLIVNHASLFFLPIGAAALAVAMRRRSAELRVLAVALFVLAGAFGWIAAESGEKAADIVKTLGGGTDSLVDQHAAAAEWAERSSIFVALLALATEWATRKGKRAARWLKWALLIFALHGFTVFARTAYLGGQIRHTEIR